MIWLFALVLSIFGVFHHRRDAGSGITHLDAIEDKILKGDTIEHDNVKLTFYEKSVDMRAVNAPNGEVKFTKTENLVIMIPGLVSNNVDVQKEYTKSFCESLKKNYLKHENFSMMCYDWQPLENSGTEAAQERGLRLGKLINERLKSLVKKVHIVAHDLGCVLAQTAGKHVKRPIDYVFGLDQRDFTQTNNSDLVLKKNAGKIVELVYSNYSPNANGHRNFFFVSKSKDSHKFIIYQAFAKAVADNGNEKAVSCENATSFTEGKCEGNRKAPLWSTSLIQLNTLPIEEQGDFYLYRT